MNKGIGIVLILVAIALGYMGITTIDDSGGSVEALGVELSVEDEGTKTQGFIYLGLALIALIGGITVMKRK